jgi:hypothetical protein
MASAIIAVDWGGFEGSRVFRRQREENGESEGEGE